jgi:hypothetical protein
MQPTSSPSTRSTRRLISRPPSASSSGDESAISAERTPRLRNLRHLDSAGSSPKGRRSSIGTSSMTSRSLSTPHPGGYGSGGMTGLGLGHPALSNALSAPRRISTFRPNPEGHAAMKSAAAANFLPPTHEAYYTHFQSASTSTSRFRADEIASCNNEHGILDPGQNLERYGSSSRQGRHKRNLSTTSIIHNPIFGIGPASPVGSVLRRIRKTASAVGLAVGRPGEYDNYTGRDGVGHQRAESGDDEDEGVKSNGTRVWYRSVSGRDDAEAI